MPIYSMIIVDDEEFNREQLVNLFDWDAVGFHIVESFASYETASAFLRRSSVDVLFTDIRLGNHDGIELAREGRALNSGMETVLISAFSEFEYARDAISAEVFDYLLKPVLPDKIGECFERLRKKLDQKRQMSEDMREYANLVRYSFYSDIFTGMITTREDAECLAAENRFDPELDRHGYLLMCLRDDEKGFKNRPLYGHDSMTAMIRQLSGSAGGSYTLYAVAMQEQQLWLLAIVAPPELSGKRSAAFAARFCSDFKAACSFDVRCEIADRDSDLLALAKRFREKRMPAPDRDGNIAKIKEYVKSGEAISAVNLIRRIAKKDRQDDEELRGFIRTVIDSIRESESPSSEPIEAYLSRLDGMDADRMMEGLAVLLPKLSSEMSGLSYNEYYISYAKRYVVEHISEELSLEKVAESVALSPAYFSRYFRELTGDRFIDYLCRMRVERAKELLLQPDIRLSDVYQMVGYHSRSRFYALFFEETGMTPHEYRKYHLGENTGGY